MNKEALFRITYGLYVVGSAHEGRINGYISNTVFQVTAEPPQVAVSCNKDNFSAGLIAGGRAFSVAILSQEVPAGVIGLFGFRSGKETEKFSALPYLTTPGGLPVPRDHVLAWLECRVVQQIDLGSHILFVGEMTDAEVLRDEGTPLTYEWYRRVKKGATPRNAPSYTGEEPPDGGGSLYRCSVCGHIYNPAEGDPDSGIPPGTPFEALPDNWKCPVCGAAKRDFFPLEEK